MKSEDEPCYGISFAKQWKKEHITVSIICNIRI